MEIRYKHYREDSGDERYEETLALCQVKAAEADQIEYRDGEPFYAKAVTECCITDDDDEWTGYAFCSAKDQFSRRIGREENQIIAL